ncbi:MAG: glycosyltransferase family 4 protein [candidate division WOR-3 bacterium]
MINLLYIPISVLISYNEYLINGLHELGIRVYVDKPNTPLGVLTYIYEKMQGRLKGKLLPTYAMPRELHNSYLKKLIKRGSVHVIHLNDLNTPLEVLRVGKEAGIPIVFVLHAAPIPEETYRQISDFIDLYIAPSRFTLSVEKEKIGGKGAVIIHHGIDVNEFKPMPKGYARRKLGFAIDNKIVLWNDRISPEKDIKTFLEAIPIVLKENRNIIFYIKGRAVVKNYYSEIKSLIKNPRIKPHVKLHIGWKRHKNLPYIYNAADIFVRTSLYENFGLGYIEAMACGIPVIAPNLTTAPEVIGDAGLLFTPGDPNDLADKVIKLLSNDELRKNLSSKSIKRVNEHFRYDIMAMKYREIYHKLLADAPCRQGRYIQGSIL